MSYRFLLASWGSLGNLGPLLTAGRMLRESGHHVRVMADAPMRAEVEAAGFEVVTWRHAPVEEAVDATDFSALKDWVRKVLFTPASAYAADVTDEIRRMPTDAVLSLDILFGVAVGAEASGVPLAFLSPRVSIRTLPGTPPAVGGLGQAKMPAERADVETVNAAWSMAMNSSLPMLNDVRIELGLPALDDIMQLFDRADRLLVATSQAFDFQAGSLPNNCCYVGPLLDVPNWSQPWQAPRPTQSDHHRALIACGTRVQGQRDMFQRAIDAAATAGIGAVVTTEPSLDVAELRAPRNVHVLRGASHDLLMNEVSLVISQGGHGTVNRSLINGLPQLILPKAWDQLANAARVEARGAGLQLPPTASEAEIAEAIKRLIAEPQFKIAARRVGDAIKSEIEASDLVEQMELIAAAGCEARQQPLEQQRQEVI
ncbi:glycosyltransferase [Bradyrhizobium sp. Ai1a-2]|uniref:glycosyltransferase n=1 Tax=Bradyrhizobium sp. Ai1a-2 TaxID=196490 RepID=UPI00047F3E5C|nr:glycosyltransferase [Bradyrhizobium sp. Ai1a-2]